ncbi:MAG: prepilin-type N-terminal cleavage/methylation domain-containing protein, partial [Verrucomicrobiota bacterium]
MIARMEHTRGRLRQRNPTGRAVGGFSLAEVLIVVAVLAIVAAIAVPNISRLVTDSSYETAKRNLNYLNGAVVGFNDANWELVLAASSGSDDEQAIFNSLRYRDTTNPATGSPYLPSTAAFGATGDTSTYRARWNGRMFVIVVPGSNGTGLD